MKKVAMMVAAVALAVMMSGCLCTNGYETVDYSVPKVNAKVDKVNYEVNKKVNKWTKWFTCWFWWRTDSYDAAAPAIKKGCCGRPDYRYVRPYCPACDRFIVHYGVCPTVTLYE